MNTLRPISVLAAVAVVFPTSAGLLTFNGFDDISLLTLNGSAAPVSTVDGTVLRLATASGFSSGSAFSSATVNAFSFSTKFVFRITDPDGVADCEGLSGADGLVFVVQSVSSSIGGAGGGLGYEGIPQSAGVEFDTFCNGEFNDPSSNHVAIDLEGSVAHELSGAFTAIVVPPFDNGQLWYAWVDYDGFVLRLFLNTEDLQPFQPVVSRTIDLPTILGQQAAYVGFTAGTGGAWGNHDIVYWEYTPFVPLCVGDFNGDDVIDGFDLGTLLSNWGSDLQLFDLNGDDVVDGADIGVLLSFWGPCPR